MTYAPIGTFLVYLRPRRKAVAALAVLLCGSIGLQLLNPQILKGFIDSAARAGRDAELTGAAGLFLGIAFLQQLLAVAAACLSESIGWQATNALRSDLLRHCLRMNPAFHKTHTPGELIDRIDGDASALANFLSHWIIQVAGNLLLLIGVLALLWRADWRIGLLMTLFSGLALLALRKIEALAVPLWTAARQRSAELYGFIEERLHGIEDIRTSGAQPYTMRRLYEYLREYIHSERKARITGVLNWSLTDLLFALGTAAAYVVMARLFRADALTIGTVYSVFFYTGLLQRPLSQITRQAQDYQKASAAMARIRAILDTRSPLIDDGSDTLPAGLLRLEFRDVGFHYEKAEDPAVENLSFDLEAGRVLGMLGRTGSGKTTLARLLFRLYDPQAGVIALGGRDIRSVPLQTLRRRVGIVTQEVQIFHATLRDNMTLFDPSHSDARLHEVLDILGLSSWYGALPDGLDTRLASGARELSAGEAQILAFTRILLRDPGLVILDEASSRLDPATEQLMDRAIGGLLAGRTGILIAHRLQTLDRADDILILEAGRIAEFGKRALLLGDPGSRYSGLLRSGLQEMLA